ncbi:hypothetical protein PS870_02032 [Pseudomonas fluorescens]|jgi:hypothetical protein|uniref:Uncharacterized protein n=1 Tax=Pseudomonas fluorescens TaxID=294 RepID=A0A5E7JE28_PSEFL|nr:hypothetical protein [Pseudomonas fluorescens]VVO85497.1 hypothetical protein PS870_02032 [Pseudomonas fluorescens]
MTKSCAIKEQIKELKLDNEHRLHSIIRLSDAIPKMSKESQSRGEATILNLANQIATTDILVRQIGEQGSSHE